MSIIFFMVCGIKTHNRGVIMLLNGQYQVLIWTSYYYTFVKKIKYDILE